MDLIYCSGSKVLLKDLDFKGTDLSGYYLFCIKFIFGIMQLGKHKISQKYF